MTNTTTTAARNIYTRARDRATRPRTLAQHLGRAVAVPTCITGGLGAGAWFATELAPRLADYMTLSGLI